MDPVTMMMIAQGVPAVLNLIKGGVQGLQARRLSKQGRPDYKIPEAAISALNLSKYMAGQNELPGQTIMEEKLGRTTAGAIDNLKDVSTSPVALASNIAKIYKNQVDGQNSINMAAAQNELNQDQNLVQAYNNFAPYEDRKWNYNNYQPYVQAKTAESALRSGSFNNLATGTAGLGSALGSGAMAKYYEDILSKYSPGYSDPNSSADGGTSGYQSNNTGNINAGLANPTPAGAPMLTQKQITDIYRGWTPKYSPTF